MQKPHLSQWFSHQRTMQERIAAFDWTSTSLGAVDRWPGSLRATIKTLVASRYPMILLWGEDLIQVYNDAYTGLIGDKHPDALGKSIQVTQAESWDTIGPMIRNVMLTGVSNWVPAQQLAVNRFGFNEETYFSLSYSAVEDDENIVRGMLCVCSEVTQQVLSERRLLLQRDLISKAGQTRDVTQVCIDIASTIAGYAQDIPFMRLYLRGRDGILHIQSRVPAGFNVEPDTSEWMSSDPWQIRRAVAGEAVVIDELPQGISISGGTWGDSVRTAISLPLPSATAGQPLGVIVMGISPNAVLDQAYRAFFDLVASQVSIALRNAMAHEEERNRAEALAALDRAKTDFFSNVSHEFRTPLTLMLGPLEELLAKKESLSVQNHTQVKLAHENALRLLKLVNTLLDFSRIEANRAQAVYKETDLSVLTTGLASSFESAFQKAGVGYVTDIQSLQHPIPVDPDMWEKIVLNLISNALKFTFEGTVAVTLTEDEDHVVLAVQDTGVGIPADELPQVFDRFHRVPNRRSRSHEGTGIGLALVKELVAMHAGTIDVESEVDTGTTFSVRIPKQGKHPVTSGTSADSAPTSTAVRSEWFVNEASLWTTAEQNKTHNDAIPDGSRQQEGVILVVDDNSQMRAYLERILTKHFRVIAAANGVEALRLASECNPDLVLTDIMMPGMNGFELLRAIRNEQALCHLPVVLLSARAGQEATVEGLEKGANDYLVKPFYAGELIARIRAQLDITRTRAFAHQLELRVEERTRDLRQLNAELQQFAYVTSHDLQEPLRKILVFSGFLEKKHSLPDGATEHLHRITDAALRMRHLIQDLLVFSRLRQHEVQFEDVDLNDVLATVLAEFDLAIGEKNLSVNMEKLPTISGVPLQLTQLFRNLLSNVIKFAHDDRAPELAITATTTLPDALSAHPLPDPGRRYWCISFTDNGIGFDENHVEKIFGIFQRLHNREKFPGTGIGLAVCKRVVENHQGVLYATSTEGQGSTFWVLLPVV
jgi:signal transduction histidine kinase